MNRQELMRRVGSLEQVAGVRSMVYQEGRARGSRAYQVHNGVMRYTLMAEKCLDMTELQYKGMTLNFLSKPGLQGRNHYDTNGPEAQRSIMGGMFFTCGLENIGGPCRVEGKEYPMHGRIRTTPGELTGVNTWWEGDTYHMEVHGEMREAELFGENLVLRRSIRTAYPGREIKLVDEIENQGFRPEPVMLLYHCNVGYPLLDEDARILIPTRKVIPRDEHAALHIDSYDRMEPPVDGEPESVFLHQLAADQEGNTFAGIIQEKLGLGIQISFNQNQLPHFMEWKSIASGDYVVGLEPANSTVWGRAHHQEQGTLDYLQPWEKRRIELTFRILEGEEELRQMTKEWEALSRS